MLADVHQGGPEHVQQAIDAAREAHGTTGRAGRGRSAPPSSSAPPSCSPGRGAHTLNAATMLGQSKTAHQAEIDAACELIDFLRFNVEFMTAHLRRAAGLLAGRLEPDGVPAARGLRASPSRPFNFTAIGGNLSSSPALMGNTVVWKPASTATLSAHYVMRAAPGGRPARRRDQPRLRLRRDDRRRRAREPASSPASTSPARPPSSTACGRPSATTSPLPQLPADRRRDRRQGLHRRAPVAPTSTRVATAIVRGSFEYQGQKCSAASRVYAPSNLWPELRERLADQVRRAQDGRRRRLLELHGRGHRQQLVQDAEGGDRGGARARARPRSSSAAATTTARATSSSRP